MRTARQIGLLFLVSACATSVAQEVDLRDEVRAILKLQSRPESRQSVATLGEPGLEALMQLASNQHEQLLIRTRSISLLGAFRVPEVTKRLIPILNDPEPVYRAFAMQALMELKDPAAIPALIKKLDDNATCLTRESSHEQDFVVRCSDEAVRALETITGLSFEKEPLGNRHRNVEPWKKWWSEQRKPEATSNSKSVLCVSVTLWQV